MEFGGVARNLNGNIAIFAINAAKSFKLTLVAHHTLVAAPCSGVFGI
jgi:hypothetical protein